MSTTPISNVAGQTVTAYPGATASFVQPMPAFASQAAPMMLDEKQIISQKNQALGQLDKQRKNAVESLNRQYEHQKQLIHFEAERDLQTQMAALEQRRQQTIMAIEQENMQYRMQIDQANLQQRMQIEQTSSVLTSQAQQQRMAREHQEKFAKYNQTVGHQFGNTMAFAPSGTTINSFGTSVSGLPQMAYPATVGNLNQIQPAATFQQ